jgi:hypothetical protein
MPTPTTKATCPCCFRPYAVQGGLMSKHGYRAPGRGTGYAPHIGGSCVASRQFKPLEVSPEGTLHVLTAAKRDRNAAEEWLAWLTEHDDGDGVKLSLECNPTEAEIAARRERDPHGRLFGSSGLRRSVTRQVTRQDLTPENHANGTFRPYYSGVHTWPQLVDSHKRTTQVRIDTVDAFQRLATEMVLQHHPGVAETHATLLVGHTVAA